MLRSLPLLITVIYSSIIAAPANAAGTPCTINAGAEFVLNDKTCAIRLEGNNNSRNLPITRNITSSSACTQLCATAINDAVAAGGKVDQYTLCTQPAAAVAGKCELNVDPSIYVGATYDPTTRICKIYNYDNKSGLIGGSPIVTTSAELSQDCESMCRDRGVPKRCSSFEEIASAPQIVEAIYNVDTRYCQLVKSGVSMGGDTISEDACLARCDANNLPTRKCAKFTRIYQPVVKVEATYNTLSTVCTLLDSAGKILGSDKLSNATGSAQAQTLCKQRCDVQNSPVKECAKFTVVTPPAVRVAAKFTNVINKCELRNMDTGAPMGSDTTTSAECRARCDVQNSPTKQCADFTVIDLPNISVEAFYNKDSKRCELKDAVTGKSLGYDTLSATVCEARCDAQNSPIKKCAGVTELPSVKVRGNYYANTRHCELINIETGVSVGGYNGYDEATCKESCAARSSSVKSVRKCAEFNVL